MRKKNRTPILPLWQRGIKGDLESLSISLSQRERFGSLA
jgi:hypothetical protein